MPAFQLDYNLNIEQDEPDLLNKTNTSPRRWLVTDNMHLLILIRVLFSSHKDAINLALVIFRSVSMNEKKDKPLADYFLLSAKIKSFLSL